MKSKNQCARKMIIPTIKRKSVVIGIVGILFIFNGVLFSDDAILIKDPVPTVTEDKVVYLEEVQKIGVDLGNDEYLFVPKSIAADGSNVFVYDSSQKKILRFSSDLKFLGSFGRVGQGPGEFSGGKWVVQLSIGQDGNVYANDFHGFKIMGYTREGKYLKTFKYGNRPYYDKPVCDKQGNILYAEMKNNTIEVKTDQGILLTQCKSEKLHHSYLFKIPSKALREDISLMPFIPFATWKLTRDSKLLLFFQTSSVMSIFNGKEYIKTFKIWPKDALPNYKKKYLAKIDNIAKFPGYHALGVFFPMFGDLIVDQDDPNTFYLIFCGDYSIEETSAVLYAFNLSGELLKVIQIPTSPGNKESYRKLVRMQAKVNNTFYAIRGEEEVVLYKEKKK